MDPNIQNIACLGKTRSIFKKQHLSKIEAQFIKMLSNTKTELKKFLSYKKQVRRNDIRQTSQL